MKVYIISCALRHAMHDYAPLWEALDKAGARRAMEAVWFYETSESLEAVTNAVLKLVTPDDRVFVAEIGAWTATRLLDDTAAWLKGKLP